MRIISGIMLLWTTNKIVFRRSQQQSAQAFLLRPLSIQRSQTTRFLSTETETETETESNNNDNTIKWTTDTVRSTFIDYFHNKHNHTVVPSSACAPLNDPTLLFTNAGMNQFKPIFLGQVDPLSTLAKLQRAVNTQKCIRAGGKHNDLEDVGVDTYHHTFFEMLGTWSFYNNYSKASAVDMAWDLLTRVYALNPDQLYATYFEGNEFVPADTAARDAWLQYLPADRVIPCHAADNFWEMGETGPCGPCTEIHYDRVAGRADAAALVNQDDPNVIEIWNIVFIQFNRESATALSTLPSQHIDTGMGLERLTSILQDKSSNYDIDCFQPVFKAIQAMTPTNRPYTGRVGADDTDFGDTAYRAIADHARCLTFAIADGVIPNNEGRGYVLRRILRRAARYGQQVLQLPVAGFMAAQLVPVVVETFGEAFPELKQQEQHIIRVIQEEEDAFGSMLQRGIHYFEQEITSSSKSTATKLIPGTQAFYLYDTLGFPLDLTQLMAHEAGFTVDTAGFDHAMQEQKDRSRQAQKLARNSGSTEEMLGELQAEQTAWLQQEQILPTDDSFKYEWNVDVPATVMAIYTLEGRFLSAEERVSEGTTVGLILNQSSLYAVAGGQETDQGIIRIDGSDQVFRVNDVHSYAGFVVHEGVLESVDGNDDQSSLKVGHQVTCRVDYNRRQCIAPNHSMTHVLNAALRHVLHDASCDQRGSLCNDEKLRFDFSYNKALNAQQLSDIESFCQRVVQDNVEVSSQVLPLVEAQALNGVRAVFGEVYPDPVRVITVGGDISLEFCGGTHVKRTGEAQAFCLVEETAVAKGIRRITAVTQQSAVEALRQGELLEAQVLQMEQQQQQQNGAGALRKLVDSTIMSAALKLSLRARLEILQKAANEFQKKLLQQKVDVALNQLEQDLGRVVESSSSNAIVMPVDIGGDSKASQRVLSTVQRLAPDRAFLGLSQDEGLKVFAFSVVPDSLVDQGFRADEWIQAALEPVGGRGGGKPGNAQGQAKECEDLEVVIAAAQRYAESQFSSSTNVV